MKSKLSALLLLAFAVTASATPVTNLRVTDLQSTQATFSWDGEGPFVVWGQSFGTYGIIWTPIANGYMANSWTVYGLTPGTSKSYRVNEGKGLPWPQVSFTTLTAPILKQPNDTTARVGSLRSVYLSFVASPTATITLLEAPVGMYLYDRYIRWRPDASQVGAHSVRVQVANELGSVEALFTWTVIP